jgi:hypothetical protein
MRYGSVRHSGLQSTLTVPHTLEKGYRDEKDSECLELRSKSSCVSATPILAVIQSVKSCENFVGRR